METTEDFEQQLALQNFKIRRAGAATLEHLEGISTHEEREERARAREQKAARSDRATDPPEPSIYESSGAFLLKLDEALTL